MVFNKRNAKNEGTGIASIIVIVILAVVALYYFFSSRPHPGVTNKTDNDVSVEVVAPIPDAQNQH